MAGWGGLGGVMNWAIVIDMYTLICIKWITNKNLLYKKINKIKFKNSKTKPPKNNIEHFRSIRHFHIELSIIYKHPNHVDS